MITLLAVVEQVPSNDYTSRITSVRGNENG